jgi:hypothetical protein
MEHIPTTESYVQMVVRIAKELDISVDKASITCDAFELAFSDPGSRQAIFGMIDQLDESAVRKGEPMGLIIRYTVNLGEDGIHVGRYADEIPSGDVVDLTPSHQACIFLRITDDFPTQELLGPMIVNRPQMQYESVHRERAFDGKSFGNQFDRDRFDRTIPSDISCSEPAKPVILLGPIRLTFNERFPLAVSKSQPGYLLRSADRTALDPPHHLLPGSALSAGNRTFQSSGLSPPFPSENLGHSERKMFLRH